MGDCHQVFFSCILYCFDQTKCMYVRVYDKADVFSGGRPQCSVYHRRLPVNGDAHNVSRHRTHNLPIVSPTRYQWGYL